MNGPTRELADARADHSPLHRARFVVVLDRYDTAAVTREALAAHLPASGVVTVHPTTGTTSSRALADDVLIALGARADALYAVPVPQREEAVWRIAIAWTRARRIHRTVFLRAHRFTAARWHDVVTFQESTDATVLVICPSAELPQAARAALADVAHTVTDDLTQVHTLLCPSRVETPASVLDTILRAAPPADHEFPAIPHSALHRFRADAWRGLPPTQFAALDAQYRFGRDAACAWIATRPQYTENTHAPVHLAPALLPNYLAPREAASAEQFLADSFGADAARALFAGLLCIGRDPIPRRRYPFAWSDPEELQAFLSVVAESSASPSATETRIRGVQAGLLLHGMLLATPANLAAHGGPGMSSTVLDERICTLAAEHSPHPVPAAALVIGALTGLSREQITRVRIDAVDDGGARLRCDGVYTVPAPARPLLRAARMLRELEGADGDQRLLAGRGWRGALDRLGELAAASGYASLVRHEDNGYRPWHHRCELYFVADPIHGPRYEDPGLGRGR